MYLTLETEGENILEIMGLYSSYEKALKSCEEHFEDRGFDSKEDEDLFENDYAIKEVELDGNIDMVIQRYENIY